MRDGPVLWLLGARGSAKLWWKPVGVPVARPSRAGSSCSTSARGVAPQLVWRRHTGGGGGAPWSVSVALTPPRCTADGDAAESHAEHLSRCVDARAHEAHARVAGAAAASKAARAAAVERAEVCARPPTCARRRRCGGICDAAQDAVALARWEAGGRVVGRLWTLPPRVLAAQCREEAIDAGGDGARTFGGHAYQAALRGAQARVWLSCGGSRRACGRGRRGVRRGCCRTAAQGAARRGEERGAARRRRPWPRTKGPSTPRASRRSTRMSCRRTCTRSR